MENKRIVGIASHAHNCLDFDVHFNHTGTFIECQKKFNIILLGVSRLNNAEARHKLCKTAFEQGCTDIIFIDVDHKIPIDLIDVLMSHGDDVAMVSALICKRGFPYQQVGFVKYDDKGYVAVKVPDTDKCYDVDICAFGCTRINLDWMKQLDQPFFRDAFVADKKDKFYNKRSDAMMCSRLKELGGRVVIDARTEVGHALAPEYVLPSNRHLMMKMYLAMHPEKFVKGEFQVPVYAYARDVYDDEDYGPFKYVFDIGCGDGKKLCYFFGHLDECVGAIDVNEVKVMEAQKILPYCKFLLADINKVNGLQVRDDTLFICADVLEHIEDVQKVFDIIPPGQYCVFSTPDGESIGEDVKTNPTHVHCWSEDEFRALFSDQFVLHAFVKYDEIVNYKGMIAFCQKKEVKNGDSSNNNRHEQGSKQEQDVQADSQEHGV